MSNPTDPGAEQPTPAPPAAAPQYPEAPAPEPQYAPPAAPQYAAPAAPQYGAPQYTAPQYGAPQYAAQGVPQYPAAPRTNTLSIIALISAFVLPFVVPVVLGHISLGQIKRTGESGRGMAIAALVLGYIEVGFWVIWAIALMLAITLAATTTY
ncbi:DUF4190 domain-containing protein [Leucobacter soli]|uniref:DUF4190 domain-containing protein n=1 Tax=Leucobacter soli TaxID=2812850 RepID=A0A916NKX6_9MICO|nr:DUF4190 domain-containing protein [Leucobacter soli]CAG7599635.1 hypothetical protein LEUCIP111803_00312 [Leucobacter soli]